MKQDLAVPIRVLCVIFLLKGNTLPQRSSHEVLKADTLLFANSRPLLPYYFELTNGSSWFSLANQDLASVQGSSFQPSTVHPEVSTEDTGQSMTGRGSPSA